MEWIPFAFAVGGGVGFVVAKVVATLAKDCEVEDLKERLRFRSEADRQFREQLLSQLRQLAKTVRENL